MHFELSDDQKMLVDSVASFVKKEVPVTYLRHVRGDAVGWTKKTWKHMGELGWLGLPIPEAAGGFGGSFVDAALLIEQLGKTLAPEPYVASVLLAGTALARQGSAAQQQRWLAPMIAGDLSLALAALEPKGRFDARAVATRADRRGAGYELRGQKSFVLNGHAADALVVSAQSHTGLGLFVVDPKTPGVSVQSIKTMDGHHAAMIALEGAAAERLDGDDRATDDSALLDELMDLGAAACTAEGAGIMQAVLDMTTEYLRTREQFGVKIGSFQALQHRAVDMFIETELARSTMILAALKVSDASVVERQQAISTAKTQLAVSGRFVTQQAIQLHGGIGVTDEHDVGLYFKRMHVLNALFGDEEHHVARFAALPTFTHGLESAL